MNLITDLFIDVFSDIHSKLNPSSIKHHILYSILFNVSQDSLFVFSFSMKINVLYLTFFICFFLSTFVSMANWTTYIKEYQNYLKLERGLSINTIENYSFDIEKLATYLTENQINVSPITITEEQIQGFIYYIASLVNPRSQSRIISGLKSFFAYVS